MADAAEMGACDFVEHFAAPLPLQVICDMLGVPAADEKQIFDWTNVILGAGDPDFGGTFEALFEGALGMYNYAQALGQDRLDHPRRGPRVDPDARRRRRPAADARPSSARSSSSSPWPATRPPATPSAGA